MTNASRDALRETIPPVLRRLRREKRYTKTYLRAPRGVTGGFRKCRGTARPASGAGANLNTK